MSEWAKEDLDKIAESDHLHISPVRQDGKTFGTPTWIWAVVVDGALYVRPYNGGTPAGTRQPCGQPESRLYDRHAGPHNNVRVVGLAAAGDMG